MVQFDDLLGTPFKVGGRDRNGFDCYGYILFLEKRLGKEMPDLNKEYTERTYHKEIEENANRFIKLCELQKVENPEPENILLFYDEKGRACHVGLYLKNGDFTHCDYYGVRVNNLDTYFRKHWEAYKWQQ
jgi:cell wall-associated NlpC family hydrolase